MTGPEEGTKDSPLTPDPGDTEMAQPGESTHEMEDETIEETDSDEESGASELVADSWKEGEETQPEVTVLEQSDEQTIDGDGSGETGASELVPDTVSEPEVATEEKILTEVEEIVAVRGGMKEFKKSGKPKGLPKMRERYDLREGKLKCQCLIRTWRFCRHIKELADNKITPLLLRTRSIEEQREVDNNKRGNIGSQPHPPHKKFQERRNRSSDEYTKSA